MSALNWLRNANGLFVPYSSVAKWRFLANFGCDCDVFSPSSCLDCAGVESSDDLPATITVTLPALTQGDYTTCCPLFGISFTLDLYIPIFCRWCKVGDFIVGDECIGAPYRLIAAFVVNYSDPEPTCYLLVLLTFVTGGIILDCDDPFTRFGCIQWLKPLTGPVNLATINESVPYFSEDCDIFGTTPHRVPSLCSTTDPAIVSV